jgi:hypothetical protein
VPVWYVAPLEMNDGTHLGQGYNQPTKGCSAEERPNKRPLTFKGRLSERNWLHTDFSRFSAKAEGRMTEILTLSRTNAVSKPFIPSP